MSHEQSEIEGKAFKIFGIFLIILSLFSLFLAITGSNVYEDDTISLEGSSSKTIGLDFDKGQTIFINYNINEGPDEINLMVESGAILGGDIEDLENVGTNKFKFEVNKTQNYYISFINTGDTKTVFHYEIAVEGYNVNSVCYFVSFIALILGLIILLIFYKEKIFQL